MSKFILLDEYSLVVFPRLAVRIGLNEAIVLQQIHFLLQNSRNHRDGHKWVYNSYKSWLEIFPFFSKNTLIRTLESLEKQGLIITGCYNKLKMDKTKWYTVNYDTFNNLEPVDNSCG